MSARGAGSDRRIVLMGIAHAYCIEILRNPYYTALRHSKGVKRWSYDKPEKKRC